jgi:dissimilatory sulfite reductase (desulfoviridin) alpha/beta subunit
MKMASSIPNFRIIDADDNPRGAMGNDRFGKIQRCIGNQSCHSGLADSAQVQCTLSMKTKDSASRREVGVGRIS